MPTKFFLPQEGERVLVISKWGHVSAKTFKSYGQGEPSLFSPDALKPNVDVKWWMPMPPGGWKSLKDEKPREDQEVLAMGGYGDIFSAKYKRHTPNAEPELIPVLGWKYQYWMPMPELPAGVKLNY